jgi:hypothetical protein
MHHHRVVLTDAFGDLVLSAVTLLHWFNRASFSFEEEPGEYRWVFTSKTKNEIELKILNCSDIYLLKRDHECDVLFQTRHLTRLEFGRAVLEAGNKLLEEHGEAGYLEKWVEYPFPMERLSELTRLLEQLSPKD